MVEDLRVVFEDEALSLDGVTECARTLARALKRGELVYLEGPLGAGKTTFVRALAEGLKVTDPVRSPSFTIANIYKGPVTVQHLDLYRLDEVDDEDALALEEYLDQEAVTLVEWPESGKERLGKAAWTVVMDHDSIDTRRLTVATHAEDGPSRWVEALKDG